MTTSIECHFVYAAIGYSDHSSGRGLGDGSTGSNPDDDPSGGQYDSYAPLFLSDPQAYTA